RNSVRFVRTHGTVLQKLRFVLSTLYAIPLELLAVVLEREEELKLGLLTYRRALAWFCLEETGAPPEVLRGRARPTLRQVWRALARAPPVPFRAPPPGGRPARGGGPAAQVGACIPGRPGGGRGRPRPPAGVAPP